MGWSFRKSIGMGPFRINLSKGGVGLSTGVKGARVSTGPGGTNFYGGWGPFRYRKKLAPGVGSVAPAGKPRGAWGVGTFLMLAVVVGVWAFTKYYKPAKPEKTHHTPAAAPLNSHATKHKTRPAATR